MPLSRFGSAANWRNDMDTTGRAHIPVIELPQYSIAIFFWQSDRGGHLGLRFNPCSSGVDSSRLLYDVHPGEDRIVPLSVDKGGYFTVDDAPTPDAATSLYMPLNLGVLIPFRIPGKNIQALYTSTLLRLVSVSHMSLPWTGSPPLTLTFQPDGDDAMSALLPGIDLHLGRCTVPAPSQIRPGHHLGPHWARLVFHTDLKYTSLCGAREEDHSCSEDHIDNWRENTKVFHPPWWQPAESLGDPPLPPIKLCFTPCPLNPGVTLVVEITGIAGDDADTAAPSGEPDRSGLRSLLAWAADIIWRAFGWKNASS